MLGMMYVYGIFNMYFHQDDLDWFIMMNQSFYKVILAPLSDHINYIFRILFKIEWDLFHLYFPAYLLVSTLMHALVVVMLYKLAHLTSKRQDLAAIVALIFTINTNWNEVVLWVSGQTISITVLFVLMTLYAIWQKRGAKWWMLLSMFTSALALGMLAATLLMYGIDIKKRNLLPMGKWIILIGIIVLLFYKYVATDGTNIEFSAPWIVDVVGVMGLAVVNTVFGRLFIPFDSLELVRIVMVCGVLLFVLIQKREELVKILADKWSVFLILQILFYYLVVAVGRAQYGVGIMRAERYAYMGLALILLLTARILRKTKIEKWIWVVPTILIIQLIGFERRASIYSARPLELKQLVYEVNKNPEAYNSEDFLPHFVLNDERLTYDDLKKLIRD